MKMIDDIDFQMELEATLEALNAQLDAISKTAKLMGCLPHDLRTKDGQFLLVEPLVAKANVVIALEKLRKGTG